MEIPGYRGNLSWLGARTLFLTRHGSHAYGLATPESDLDLKGFAVPPRPYYYGFAQRFEQAEVREPDAVVYELRKFVKLAAECNPSILEVLFTHPSDHLGVTPLGEAVLDARGMFVSRKARHTFSGYAMAQLRRLEQHHRWIVAPPQCPPRREDFGLDPLREEEVKRIELLHAEVDRVVQGWQPDLSALPRDAQDALRERIEEALASRLGADRHDDRAAMLQLGFDDDLAARFASERAWRAAQRTWQQFDQWQRGRNPRRAELEARYGYDTKFGGHVVRLLRMAREILTTGEVRVRRPDADELRAIRGGAWPFERLHTWAHAEDAALDALAAASPLPRGPDMKALDRLCAAWVERALATLPDDAGALS